MEDSPSFIGIGTSSRIQLLKCSSEAFLRAQEKLSDKYGIYDPENPQLDKLSSNAECVIAIPDNKRNDLYCKNKIV